MNDVSSSTVGIAARYAEQIKELLALRENGLNARRTLKQNRATEDHTPSQNTGSLGAFVDLRV
jgi:hypothetical protein